MNVNLLNIINRIVAEQGEGILDEPRRVSAFFTDLAKDEPKPQKNAFVKCLEHESAQALKNAPEPERDVCKQRLAQKLHDEEGLDLGLCGEALELLAAVLFVTEQKIKKNVCKNCGKELQEEWKTCPFCTAPTEADQAPEAANAEMQVPITQGDESIIENTQLRRKLKKAKYALIAAIVLGIICTTISVIVGYGYYDAMGELYDSLSDKNEQYEAMSSNYYSLLSENNKIRNLLNIGYSVDT